LSDCQTVAKGLGKTLSDCQTAAKGLGKTLSDCQTAAKGLRKTLSDCQTAAKGRGKTLSDCQTVIPSDFRRRPFAVFGVWHVLHRFSFLSCLKSLNAKL